MYVPFRAAERNWEGFPDFASVRRDAGPSGIGPPALAGKASRDRSRLRGGHIEEGAAQSKPGTKPRAGPERAKSKPGEVPATPGYIYVIAPGAETPE